MAIKPIKIFAHASGPNPWKVMIVLEELGIPYEPEWMDMAVLHTPVYEKYNPNGRLPCIIDPNRDDIVLWESGAIIEYLIEYYDTEHKISFSDWDKKAHCRQWLHFQASGQGPYFGQAAWFSYFHPEDLPSAKLRYTKEIRRVTKVLDSALGKDGYLVGGKVTFADLSFVNWYQGARVLDPGFAEYVDAECPAFKKWEEILNARATVKKLAEERAARMKQ